MNGSVQTKNGKLYVVLSYKKPEGGFKYKWVNTGLSVRGNKRKAEEMIDDIIERYRDLELISETPIEILFTDYILDWLERKKNKVQLSTWEGYEIYVKKHLIPYFEPMNLTLAEVTPKHIMDYYESRLVCGRNDHKTGGLSVQSIKKHALVMNMVFEEALIAELVMRNPVALVPLPVQEKQEQKGTFLTIDEANKMLEAFRGHDLQPLVFTTLYYGLRRSEVLGLKWDAVDFENNTLKIQHTVVKNRTVVAKDTTKTVTSRRTYPLLPEIKELLLQLREKQKENMRLFGNGYEISDYIFVWADGKQYRPDYLTRAFQRVLKEHGIPKMRFHDIRHSTASILYDKGWGLKDIQEWLGHSNIETTGNIYTHINRIRKENLGRDLSNTFAI